MSSRQCLCCICVSEGEVGIVENCARFEKEANPGFMCAMYPFECLADSLSTRVLQINVLTETKTLDNVTLTVRVAVQYRIVPSQVEAAYYKLTNPQHQIKSYVDDVVRSTLPKMSLDMAYEAKEDVSKDVKNRLDAIMHDFGYEIVAALVTDLEPDGKVKEAMNEINAAQRMRLAAQEKAEADKILSVKSAEAEAEAKFLSGTGVARQRQAIVDGLRDSIKDFSTEIPGTTSGDVMNMMMTVQYLDMLKDVGHNPANQTIFLPTSNAGMKRT